MAHATGIGTTSFIGVVTGVIASSIAAIFKVGIGNFCGHFVRENKFHFS